MEVVDINDRPAFEVPERVIGWENTNFTKHIVFNISGGINEPVPEKPTFQVVVKDPSLFTAQGQPAISSTGVMSFMPAPGVFGQTVANITLNDGQGTQNLG